MANPNGRKGATAERAVADTLKNAGWEHADRRVKNGAKDRGDIAGISGVVIEVKNCATLNLSGWLAEAHVEADNDGSSIGVVWHKRRGKGDPLDWYVTMDGRTLVELLRTVEHARSLSADVVAATMRAKERP